MIFERDKIFSSPLNKIVDFKFDDKVANVFEDMLKRSIPGYSTVIGMTGMLASKYAQDNSFLYDLGSSLGASSLAMCNKLTADNCRIVAVDNSLAMVKRSKSFFELDKSNTPIEVVCADIRNVEIKNASVVVLNYTMQFLPKKDRLPLIQKIYDGLLPGGILILSEKVEYHNIEVDSFLVDLYYTFKKLNGYSELEISQKREALENVMIPESIEENRSRILSSGFSKCELWFQMFNFVSFLAVK